ncbi:MAG: hypothetical protein ABIK43_04105 [candidate division WOR-3 bacterium]
MQTEPRGRQTRLCQDEVALWRIVSRYPIPREQQHQLFCFARELCILLLHASATCFTRRAERLLRKYLSRGLAGSLLQDVGEQVIAWRFLPKGVERG